MSGSFRAACVQVNAGNDMAANIAEASRLAREAAAAGAHFITTPENVSMMAAGAKDAFAKAAPQANHPALEAFRGLAQELGVWFLVGSLSVALEDEERLANRSYLIDGQGAIVGQYDKIHMFDADPAAGERYRESKYFKPGEAARLVETPWGLLGMTVCYDVRFPHLCRALAQAGAQVLTIPSAFTRGTGADHWYVLMRARAIETGCYVIAPAQCGVHPRARETFGHSVIIDPWGDILADGGEAPGFVIAEIDPAQVEKARAKIPSLANDRPYSLPEPKRKRIRAAG